MTTDCIVGTATVSGHVGGIASVARSSIRALIAAGSSPHVISFLDSGSFELEPGLCVQGCGGSKLLYAARIQHAALSARYALYDAVGVSRAHPRWRRTSHALWMHGTEVWHGLTPTYERALRRADFIFCNTRYTLNRHQEMHGPLETAHVCWLATEEDDAPTELADFSGPPTVLIVGRINASEGRKGHHELIASWPAVVSAIHDARLVVAGGGDGLENLRANVAASPVAHAIDILGFVEAAVLPSHFRRAHVFAMPSRQDGFGIVYAEAMRYGLPCIASRQDSGQEVNVDGVTGHNVDLDRPGELADALIALLRDTDDAKRLGANGFERWRANFRRSCFVDRFQSLWRTYTGQSPPSTPADASREDTRA